jgi:hypothetical protein
MAYRSARGPFPLIRSVLISRSVLQLLVSLVRSYRCEVELVDEDVAGMEAAQLAEAIRRRKQPHGDEVIRIVSTRSKNQLRATFRRYEQEHGTGIDEVPAATQSVNHSPSRNNSH